MAEFKDLLRRARQAKGLRDGKDLRAADVARAMDITRSAYGHWEGGRSIPKDYATLERLAAFLGVPVNSLGIDVSKLPLTAPEPSKRKSTYKKEDRRPFTGKAVKRRRKGNDG